MHNDKHLQTKGIQFEYGHIKNPNKNAVIDKGIQEIELELLKVEPSGSPVSKEVLQTAVATLNQRIRNRGISSHEILFQRDQHTGSQMTFTDKSLSDKQKDIRSKNHLPSSLSKAKGGQLPNRIQI